ncbi:MAG: oligoendopeptidase F [Verrucomicrobia bacterium]|nr:oligoendopeptidase F [Verrucomicrobiota bacterium]
MHVPTKAATTPERNEIEERDKWDLSSMYDSAEAWDRHYREVESMVAALAARQGTLGEGADALRSALELRDAIGVQLEKLQAYAAMRHHEDMRLPGPQGTLQRAETLAVRYGEATAWFQPELLQIPEARLKEWLRAEGLRVYGHYFDDLLRSKAHILSSREEELLAMAGKTTETGDNAFSLLTNTELRRRTVKDPEGAEVEVTSPVFYQALYSKDRRYRRDAFEAYHQGYLDVKSTLAATLAGTMHRDWYYSKARHYGSSLERALDAENLPAGVYHNLIGTIGRHLPLLHRYAALKKRALGLDAVHFYDLYVNLADVPERQYTWAEARTLVLDGIKPFGSEYGAVMRQAFDSRWIDVYANRGKMTGAYNMGTYLSAPYVLLNYTGTFNDVSTVAHELGHAMQSYFAKENQPPVYAGYPMFTAEVASTAAEIVFKRSMLDRAADRKERAFLINQMLEDMRQTVFRQTQFAEFELAAHTLAEKGEPMTAEVFMRIGREIYERYYGPEFVIDPGLEVECLRIPHFYTNYYVHRYANSYCAAAAIARQIMAGNAGAQERWLQFLKTGNSRYALDMLKLAGVDMTTPQPIEEAMALFRQLLDELEPLLEAGGAGQ